MNFGFGTVFFDNDSIPGKVIATLPINNFVLSSYPLRKEPFVHLEELYAALGAIMSSIADADALIIDLRTNQIGDSRTVAFMLSYLLDEGPLCLVDFVNRSGEIEESFSTRDPNDLPKNTSRYGGNKPLFVLVSQKTMSAGEDMAYSLQDFKRAKAIIGEETGKIMGFAHISLKTSPFGEEEFGKGWWAVSVPHKKPVHSITGSSWEGVGVQCDTVSGEGEWKGMDAKRSDGDWP